MAHSYLRNCVFDNLGEDYGFGSFVVAEGDIEISDCWFYNNRGFGMWLYDAQNTNISGCNIVSNDWGGLYNEGLVSSTSFSCDEFSHNGGDSTAEVFSNGGTFDFSDGSGCVFADVGGTLLNGMEMASFDLAGGENGFYLDDTTGLFIATGDQSDTLDISGNYWYPYDPDTSAFWDHMDPDASQYWAADSVADDVAACMQGGILSLPGGNQLRLARPGASESGILSHGTHWKTDPLFRKSAKAGLITNSRKITTPAPQSLAQAQALQQAQDYAGAAAAYSQFILSSPSDPRVCSAMSSQFVAAKKAGQIQDLPSFYEIQERRLTTPRAKQTAHALKLEALALNGKAQEALTGYEDLLRTVNNRRDSVRAVIACMKLSYRYGQPSKLHLQHPENQVTSFEEFARRAIALSATLVHTARSSGDRSRTPVIPTAYALYQNYPNPFNPVTEIRFDIPEVTRVELKVFNILGQEVTTLVDEVRPAGSYHVFWDSKNSNGIAVASGVYVFQLKAGKFVDSKKMVLLK
jgi:parallel beta-helix repeat protein